MAEKENKMKEGVRIIKCTCEHEFQDQLYGKGMRVHNVTKDGFAACTVCCPRLVTNKMNPALPTDPNKLMGHGLIPARKPRNLKKVAA